MVVADKAADCVVEGIIEMGAAFFAGPTVLLVIDPLNPSAEK
jgi:hypothetical protein